MIRPRPDPIRPDPGPRAPDPRAFDPRGPDPHADIVIAGGGPAGAALALRLAVLGHDVKLVTEPAARRVHAQETLAPGVSGQLAFLGLESALAAALIGEVGFEIRWGGGVFQPRDGGRPGYLINRDRFDAALLDLLAARGVTPGIGRVQAATRAENGWRVVVATQSGATPSGQAVLTSRFLVDATGRRGLLPRRRRRGSRLLGVQASWRGLALPSTARIASQEDHWIWGAPTGEGHYATTVFLDPLGLHRGEVSLSEHVQALVLASGLLDGARDATMTSAARASDATPYVEGASAGDRHLMIGEAALAIDPLSSAGVQVALQSAASAAAVLHTLDRDPAARDLVRSFWNDALARRHARHSAWAAAFYAEGAANFPTAFWTARAGSTPTPSWSPPERTPLPRPDQPLGLGRATRVSWEACVVGDRIVRHRAVNHPGLAEPVAFLDGLDLSTLLDRIAPGMTAGSIVRDWAPHVGPDAAMKVLSWAWRQGVLAVTTGHDR